jgi:lipopolysaccharide assembly protein A
MVYLVLSLFCAMLVALFAVQNSHEVLVKFLTWELHTSLALLVIGAVAAGALLLGLLALFRQVGLGLKLWDERSRSRKTATELEQSRLAGQELRKEIERLQDNGRHLAARIHELQAHLAAQQAAAAVAVAACAPPAADKATPVGSEADPTDSSASPAAAAPERQRG